MVLQVQAGIYREGSGGQRGGDHEKDKGTRG